MKRSIATALVAMLCLTALPAQANERKIKVTAPGNAVTTMEIRVTTVDKASTTDTQPETISITLAAADVMNPATKAARIVARINAAATNVTAAVDGTDPSVVIIKSNATRTITLADARPLKSGERDKQVALGPGEDPNAPVVLGLTLDGTGLIRIGPSFTASVEIEGLNGEIFTVGTEELSFSAILSLLDAMIDASPNFESNVVGNQLSIDGAVLGNNYSVFFEDSEGLSYGFSVESFPTAVSEPGVLALFLAGVLGGMVSRRRIKPGYRAP